MTQKILINTSIGGFSISKKAVLWLREKGCEEAFQTILDDEDVNNIEHYRYMSYRNRLERNDPLLLECFNALGSDFSEDAEIKIVEIPDGVDWEIGEAEEGTEWVAEKHRKWF